MQWGGGGWVAVSPGYSGQAFWKKRQLSKGLKEMSGWPCVEKEETAGVEVSVKKSM